MKISDLKKAEEIVDGNKNMQWRGWDIVHLSEDSNAHMDPRGIFKDNKWYISNIYKLEQGGWDIPERFMAD